MRPVLFHWRGFKVWSYPAMLYLGLVAGVVAGNLAAHAAGVDAFRVYVATLILIVPALLGSRLSHIATHWCLYRNDLRRIWPRGEGGADQYGGLLLVLPISVPLLAALRLPLGAYWDVGVFTILAGMVFARVGCLLNGCCAGRPSQSWISFYLPNHSGVWTRRIPTQCLEGAWAAVLLAFAVVERRSLPFPGALFLLVALAYASCRLMLESTREQETGAGRFTIDHAISAFIVVSSLALLAARWPKY